jgi:hypothetical protein
MFSKEELRVIEMALYNWDGWDSMAKKSASKKDQHTAYRLAIKVYQMLIKA